MVSGFSHHGLKAVTDEIKMIRDSCDGIFNKFEISHQYSTIGICQLIFHLLHDSAHTDFPLLNGLQLMYSTSDKVPYEKFEFFSKRYSFPRSLFDEMYADIPILVKKGLIPSCDGAFFFGATKYLVGCILHSIQDHGNSIFEAFAHIVRSRKQSLGGNEE